VRHHHFESILDECLKAVGRGESLDSVLGRHPQWADELRPLLATVQRVRRTPAAKPRLAAQQAGWQRFIAQADALRRARQRPRQFKSILDECLKAVGRGESLDSVLGRHPQWADELRPLLATVQRVRGTPTAKPRLAAQQAGWQRFMGQAVALRRAHQRPAFAVWRPLAAAASLVLVLAFTGGATVYAASNSMPDDRLYAVKLATEEARLWFAFDENDRADVLLDQADTRLTEMANQVEEGQPVGNNVLAAMRHRMDRAGDIVDKAGAPADLVARANDLSARQEQLLISIQGQVSFKAAPEYGRTLAIVHDVRLALRDEPAAPSDPLVLANGVGQVTGRVEQDESGSWTVGGVSVLVDRSTLVEGEAGSIVGNVASVAVVRGADESLHALTVSLRSQGDVAGGMRIAGVVDDVQNDRISVGDRIVTIDKHTIKDGRLREGSRVEIIGQNAGNVFAASIIHIAQPEEVETTFAYEGEVEDVSPDRWMVGGLTFVVSSTTPVDAGALFLEPGARARVQAAQQGSELVAQRITLLTAEDTEDTVAVEGVFQGRLANGHWLVGGLEVDANLSAVQLETTGTLVRAVGNRSAQDGTVVSVRSVEPLLAGSDSGLLRVEGVMTRLGQNAWLVGPARVQITDETEIDGQLLAGARALVWGRPGLSDSLEAVYIDVLDDEPLFVQDSDLVSY
jgi:hypothetical protein